MPVRGVLDDRLEVFVPGIDGDVGTQAGRRRPPGLGQIGDDDLRGAGKAADGHVQQTDGACPDDDHRVAEPRLVVVKAVQHATQWLGQRQRRHRRAGLRHRDVLAVHGTLRDEAVLGQATVDVVSEDVGVVAKLLPVAQAVEARSTADRGCHNGCVAHPVAGHTLAERRDRPGDLVPQDDAGTHACGLLAPKDSQIGSADGVGANLQENLTLPRLRRADLGDVQLLWSSENRCKHCDAPFGRGRDVCRLESCDQS